MKILVKWGEGVFVKHVEDTRKIGRNFIGGGN